jgi:EpsD family peptidyl-prolyl cis-trans isomerase
VSRLKEIGLFSRPGQGLQYGILSVAALVSACSPGGHSQDVASGDHFSVSSGELNQALAKVPPVSKVLDTTVRRNVLSHLIEEKLLANAGATDGLDRDPNVVADIEAAKRSILAAAYAAHVTSGVFVPSAQDVGAFYADHPEAFGQRTSVDMDEVLFAGPSTVAEKYAKQYDSGAGLAEVQQRATGEGGTVTSQHAVVTSDRLPTILAQRLTQLSPGSNVIFPVEEGVVFAKIRSIAPAPLSLDEATPIISVGLQAKRRDELLSKEIARLRADAKVKINDPALAPPAGNP